MCNVYLAFSIFNQKPVKKNIAVVYPTLVPAKNNMSGRLGSPTAVPTTLTTTKVPEQLDFAKIDPATIPANLFKPISKSVSAYEKENVTVFKMEKGTYKIKKIEYDGKQYDAIDLTGQ